MEYGTYLTKEQKISILEQKIIKLDAQAWESSIDKQVYLSLNDMSSVQLIEITIANINIAIEIYKNELNSILNS